MNTIPKHRARPQLTKRERKALKPANAMVRNSFREGTSQLDGEYRGSVPIYTDVSKPSKHSFIVTPDYIKTTNGVPFVRSDRSWV